MEIGTTINNAGLVILHSFFPILFEKLGLIKDKQFLSASAQLSAAQYLQYIVTETVVNSRDAASLINVLCGLPAARPVNSNGPISWDDKKLIEGLIHAAINYLPAIGETSVQGFRGNWLARNGVLTEQEDRYELTVEKKAYDILLHRSPFSFSVIKHPWMPKPLYVNWGS
jgi:hypothetical protein